MWLVRRYCAVVDERPAGALRIFKHPERRGVSHFLIRVGILLAVAASLGYAMTVAVSFSRSGAFTAEPVSPFAALLLGGATALVAGLAALGRLDRHTWDAVAEELRLADGRTVARGELVGLQLAAFVPKVRYELPGRQRSALEDRVDALLGTRQRHLLLAATTRPGLQPAAESPEGMLVAEVAGQVAASQLERAEEDPPSPESAALAALARRTRSVVVLAQTGSQPRLWHAAKALATRLDLPLADGCGEKIALHEPADLRLPLLGRLAGAGSRADGAGAPPDSLSVARDGQQLAVRWCFRSRSGLPKAAFALAVALVFAGAALGGLLDSAVPHGPADDVARYIAVPFFIGLALLVLLAIVPAALAGHGRHQLVVDGTAVIHHPPRARQRRLALTQLDAIRIETGARPSVAIVGDTAVLRCPLRADQARWLHHALLDFLGGLGDKATPYR